MAAPDFVPQTPAQLDSFYSSPEHQPDHWSPERPGELVGDQPMGGEYGFQGPDQGFALKVAKAVRPEVNLVVGENLEDIEFGVVLLATRRASLFGRGPTVHDLRIGYHIFGFLSETPPPELVAIRGKVFEGLANSHHYFECREMLSLVSDDVLRQGLDEVMSVEANSWRTLLVDRV